MHVRYKDWLICCIHLTRIPVRIVVLQASLAVYCPARSYGMKMMDLPDDMQAANHIETTKTALIQRQLQNTELNITNNMMTTPAAVNFLTS